MTISENYNDTDALKLYISSVIKIPLLSREKEKKLLKEYKKGDKEARKKLIEANLRLVITIANETKKVLNSNISVLDLIEAGNVGLIRAIDNFDASTGNRLSTYASLVIRHEIQQYIYLNSTAFKTSIEFVRAARTFYHKLDKLRSETGKTYNTSELAKIFNISEETINKYFQFSTNYVSLDEKIGDEFDGTIADFVVDNNCIDPEKNIIDSEISKALLEKIKSELSLKEQEIILSRFGFTDGEYHTLEEIGKVHGITRERVRQIEAKALLKLRQPSISKFFK